MIKFIDFNREYYSLKSEINQAINRALGRGRFVLGPQVENFEKSFARYIGSKYCVAMNSGTDALYLSLLSVGIGAGDEVVVPVNTAVPTAMAILMSGAKPIFVDCDDSFLIDIDKIPQAITKKTKAIIPVHLYGRACNLAQLNILAKKHNLILIEDCAQANGSDWQGKKVGAWGDFGCFSFYPTKNLGAYGDGGAVITNNEKAYKKLAALRFYGQTSRDSATLFGVNSRLDEIQAAILSVKLSYLDEWNKRRHEVAGWYQEFIGNPAVILPQIDKTRNNVFHLFVIRTKHRNKLRKILKLKGVETLVHYAKPLNKQAVFKESAIGLFPKAEKFSKEILSLPMYSFLKKQEVKIIAEIINQAKL